MRRLKPSDPYPMEAVGEIYITQGLAAEHAGSADQALALYDRAAALNDPKLSAMAYDRAANVIAGQTTPDPARLKAYADKALAINANDPVANFFEGVALVEQYNASRDRNIRAQALTYLNKADTLAKAAGNQTLAQNIEKIILQVTAGGGSQQ
jgi:tetratricopeptide (TPR) repeat protein